MRKLSILLAGLLIILAVSVLPAAAITWGEEDTENKYNNVGALMVNIPDIALYPTCSGTLIHPKVFLTAAHCTDSVLSRLDAGIIDAVYVNFAQDVTIGKNLEVSHIISHPDYNDFRPQSNPRDVGVLILMESVTNITPANLPSEGFLDQLKAEGELDRGSKAAKFSVVGYGGTLEWPPPQITYYDRRQFAVSKFQALLKAWLRLSQNNKATGDGGTCYGDSGGPAFWEPDENTSILVGVTSWGDAVCVASGFNYRVDIPETLDFIDDVIESLN